MENPYRKEQVILNGNYLLVTEETEVRMSHWVNVFGIMSAKNKEWSLPIQYSLHLLAFEELDETLDVRFNIYPNSTDEYLATIDLSKNIFIYNNHSQGLERFSETFKKIGKDYMNRLYGS